MFGDAAAEPRGALAPRAGSRIGLNKDELRSRLERAKDRIAREKRPREDHDDDARPRAPKESRPARPVLAETLFVKAAAWQASGTDQPQPESRADTELMALLRRAARLDDDDGEDFRNALPRAADLTGFARRHPGVLLDRALQEMQRYLTPLGGQPGTTPSQARSPST